MYYSNLSHHGYQGLSKYYAFSPVVEKCLEENHNNKKTAAIAKAVISHGTDKPSC